MLLGFFTTSTSSFQKKSSALPLSVGYFILHRSLGVPSDMALRSSRLLRKGSSVLFMNKRTDARLVCFRLTISPEYPCLGLRSSRVLHCKSHVPALLGVMCIYSFRDINPNDLITKGKTRVDFCSDASRSMRAIHKILLRGGKQKDQT